MPTSPQEYRDRAVQKALRKLRNTTTVTQDYTHVSGTTGSGIDGIELHVLRRWDCGSVERAKRLAERLGRRAVWIDSVVLVRMPDSDRLFATRDEYDAHRFVHGYVQIYRTSPELRAERVARGAETWKRMVAYRASLDAA